MPQQLLIHLTPNGQLPVLFASDTIDYKQLAANVTETLTVPANGSSVRASFALITVDADVYAKLGASVAVPGDISDGTGPVLVPIGASRLLWLRGATQLSVISAAAAGCRVCVEWFWD